MNQPDESPQGSSPVTQRYSAMREVLVPLNMRLFREEGIVHPKTAARALGFAFQGKAFILETEYDSSLLAEYSIYYHVSKGTRLFERVLGREGSLSEAEREILEAQRKSFVSVWEVTATRPDELEVDLQDMLGERETVTILDRGLSQTARPGAILHERLLPFDGFCCASGAGLPVLFPSGDPEEYEVLRETILRRCRSAFENPGTRTRRQSLFAMARKLCYAYGPSIGEI